MIDFKVWDVETVTASDFTVEYVISDEVWAKFQTMSATVAMLNPELKNMGRLMQFENYLEKQLIEKINQFDHVINNIQVGFANITFAYDNAELLKLLTVRGGLITQGKFDKLPAVNKMLQNLKETQSDKLIRPVTAFLTFNTQEGYERSLRYWGPESAGKTKELTENHKFCDTQIRVKPAPEPSNIIWENRHIS